MKPAISRFASNVTKRTTGYFWICTLQAVATEAHLSACGIQLDYKLKFLIRQDNYSINAD